MEHSFLLFLTSQVVVSMANSFVFNSRMKFAHTWYAQRNHKKFFTVLMAFSFIGKGFMTLFPYIFVREKEQTHAEQRAGAIYCFITYFFIGIVLGLLSLFVLKEKPYEEETNTETQKEPLRLSDFINEMVTLSKNKLFHYYLAIITVTYVAVGNISNMLNIAITHYGYTQEQGSLSILLYFIIGFIGCLIYDNILDKQNKGKYYLQLFTRIG